MRETVLASTRLHYHLAIITDGDHYYLISIVIWSSLITHRLDIYHSDFSHLEFFCLCPLPISQLGSYCFCVVCLLFAICSLVIISAADITPHSLSFNIAYDFCHTTQSINISFCNLLLLNMENLSLQETKSALSPGSLTVSRLTSSSLNHTELI